MKRIILIVTIFFLPVLGFSQSQSGALTGERYRVIVCSDIGGSDPDDFQSMIHYLLYADVFDTEGLIASPWGAGTKKDIFDIIKLYENDYANLKTWSDKYPAPDALRALCKQGAVDRAPGKGYRDATEGSDWIIKCAHKDDPRPLNILVWGLLEDVAQALHDDPSIQEKIRIYYIGGPNKKWGADAYNYIEENFPDLWMIESNSTYRGWFNGGKMDGSYDNLEFFKQNIDGHGALGTAFGKYYGGSIKMGDTPSVAWLLHGNSDDPTAESWGGSYANTVYRPKSVFYGHTNKNDKVEVFGIIEIVLDGPDVGTANDEPQFTFTIAKQDFQGYYYSNGKYILRFAPKAVGEWKYVIKSDIAELDGGKGVFTAVEENSLPKYEKAVTHSHWWTDKLEPEFKEGAHYGAVTVNQWRKAFLDDFAARMDRCLEPK